MSSDLSWEKEGESELYEGFNFSVREEEVVLPSGVGMDFEYIQVPYAVAVLGFTVEGEIILVSEWRQSVERVVEYGLPGGGCHDGEVPVEAARRELLEETGYVAGEMEELLTAENNVGVSDGMHTFFVAYDCEKVEEPDSPDVGEETLVRTETREDVYAAALSGEISDARTLVPLLYFQFQESVSD